MMQILICNSNLLYVLRTERNPKFFAIVKSQKSNCDEETALVVIDQNRQNCTISTYNKLRYLVAYQNASLFHRK